MRKRYEQLTLIDDKRIYAQYHVQGYPKRIARAFNKKFKLRNLKVGDLVLKELRGEISDLRGKMKPRWSLPFVIKRIMSGVTIKITNLDEEEMFQPINMDRLRKYNPRKEKKKEKMKTPLG